MCVRVGGKNEGLQTEACLTSQPLPSAALLPSSLPPSPASEDDSYAKAYFRRAVLSACLGEYGAAGEDLAACAHLDPSTRDECEREARRMEARAAAAEAKQRGALKGFFDR